MPVLRGDYNTRILGTLRQSWRHLAPGRTETLRPRNRDRYLVWLSAFTVGEILQQCGVCGGLEFFQKRCVGGVRWVVAWFLPDALANLIPSCGVVCHHLNVEPQEVPHLIESRLQYLQ